MAPAASKIPGPELRRGRSERRAKDSRSPSSVVVAPPPAASRPPSVFPKQLLEVLSDAKLGQGVIEWLSHGHAFAIKNTARFAAELMPRFTRGKLTSFQRQLNLYGFRKVTKGADTRAGALVYFHPAFKRGRPEMMQGIKRIACKGALSLNRLRNDDVPYDASVPSEDTPEPEQDVNSLHPVVSRKRFAEERREPPAKRRSDAGLVEMRQALRLDESYELGDFSPEAFPYPVMPPPASARPAPPPAVDLRDLPTRGPDFAFHGGPGRHAGARRMPFTRARVGQGESTPPNQLGKTSTTAATLRVAEAAALATDASRTMPQRLNIPLPKHMLPGKWRPTKPEEAPAVKAEPRRDGATWQGAGGAEHLVPPPGGMPLSGGGLFASIPATTMAAKERLMRGVSEASNFSINSDLFNIEPFDEDLDVKGLFE